MIVTTNDRASLQIKQMLEEKYSVLVNLKFDVPKIEKVGEGPEFKVFWGGNEGSAGEESGRGSRVDGAKRAGCAGGSLTHLALRKRSASTSTCDLFTFTSGCE